MTYAEAISKAFKNSRLTWGLFIAWAVIIHPLLLLNGGGISFRTLGPDAVVAAYIAWAVWTIVTIVIAWACMIFSILNLTLLRFMYTWFTRNKSPDRQPA
jgi:hypothetical protein